MNLYQHTGPDTTAGKLLLSGRFLWQWLCLRLRSTSFDASATRLAWQLVPRYTMVSLERLLKLYALGAVLTPKGIEGAVVECGVWNGGSSAMIAAGLLQSGTPKESPRAFWLFDSFEGLPEPTEADEPEVRAHYFPGWCRGEVGRVREAHEAVGHGLSAVNIIPGWFDATLEQHRTAIGPIAFLHIDADWYDSVTVVLQVLYEQVVSGGIVVIDDYGSWSGCRKAVHDFFGAEGVATLGLQPIDGHAVYFYKP